LYIIIYLDILINLFTNLCNVL